MIDLTQLEDDELDALFDEPFNQAARCVTTDDTLPDYALAIERERLDAALARLRPLAAEWERRYGYLPNWLTDEDWWH